MGRLAEHGEQQQGTQMPALAGAERAGRAARQVGGQRQAEQRKGQSTGDEAPGQQRVSGNQEAQVVDGHGE
ncbi:hypothetical protein D3C75_1239180 [compost metagenome]